jgi:hypothetical protein
MTVDLAQAVSYIEEHGTELERARANYVLYGTRPERSVVLALGELQNADGGFPFRMVKGNPTGMNNTHGALLRLEELGLLDSGMAGRAFEYILSNQRGDGGWDEEAAVAEYGPPPWACPGEIRARIFLSAQSAFWLAIGGFEDRSEFPEALGFLAEHQGESGRLEGFLHTTWIATSAFLMAGEGYNEAARKGLVALLAEPLYGWVDSQISWALHCLGMAGLPKENPFVGQSLAELTRRQSGDGRWASEDGEARTVGAVIEVLKVLKLYGELPRF